MRDGQFSDTRIVSMHVKHNGPTATISSVLSVGHFVQSQPTFAIVPVAFEHVVSSTSAVLSSSARSSSDIFVHFRFANSPRCVRC